MSHKYSTRLATGNLKRKVFRDDSSDNSDAESTYSVDDNDVSGNESDDNIVDNKLEYYRFLNKLFPSNYSKERIKNIKRQRLSDTNNNFKFRFPNKNKYSQNEFYDEGENLQKKIYKNKNRNKKYKSKPKKITQKELINLNSNKNILSEDENDNDSDDNDNLFNEDKLKDLLKENVKKNIQIILNMKNGDNKFYNFQKGDNKKDYDSEDENNNDEYEDDIGNNLIEILNPYLNKYSKDGDSESEYEDSDDDSEDEKLLSKKFTSQKKKSENTNKNNTDPEELENAVIDNVNPDDLVPTKPSNARKNYNNFCKILEEDEKEQEYFKKHLSFNQQKNAIEKLQQIKNMTTVEKPYLIHLIDLDIPDVYKACALTKINNMRAMGSGFGNSEYFKVKSWVETFIKIPFNKYNNLPITFADGIEKCHDFMEDAKKTLDSVAFGLDDAKIQIMQMIGLWLVNPNAVGTAIAIKGPPGTGKTTLIKEGISKILNRPFALVPLGGCGDSGFLDGFEYTYEGSKSGKIIEILIKAGCMNPVILFDELDKISDTPRGAEITGVLTHLTDVTQNSKFSDKYLSEISLDMSKALYIFSYNDEHLVNPILKDRMYKIETKGYKLNEKLTIAKEYLIPKIMTETKFKKDELVFNDEILEYIVKDFTQDESGVRNLKRCLEIIFTKLNLYRLMKPGCNIFPNSLKSKEEIKFPLKLNTELVDGLIKKTEIDKAPFGMYN